MNPYIKQLNKYLTENSPDCNHSETDSVLELLYGFYTECERLAFIAGIKIGARLENELDRS